MKNKENRSALMAKRHAPKENRSALMAKRRTLKIT
jgi:hypothetical protein